MVAKALTWNYIGLFKYQKEDIYYWSIIWGKSSRKWIQRDRWVPHLIKCVLHGQKVWVNATLLKLFSKIIKIKRCNYFWYSIFLSVEPFDPFLAQLWVILVSMSCYSCRVVSYLVDNLLEAKDHITHFCILETPNLVSLAGISNHFLTC